MKTMTFAAALGLLAAPALAQDGPAGDASAGQEIFDRNCVACHVVVDDSGETLAGRNAQTGPNLYGVAGRQVASIEDFRYSDSLAQVGAEDGLDMEWNEEHFVAYVQDPTGWLREVLDDRRARGKMAFQLRSEEDAQNVYAYLHSLAPPEEGEMAEEGEGEGS
ncbi:c-type cytochrome [Histidinibacterium aquaticum]|uniref:C-type cytochrome n=1 Tax=Histidinibacterium aquaticum TaxID=2613962 RepID=A0A5J5GH72_9RHOB|nr:c-type cytochrome [Histidinibacterium aquaticum]KAA9006884.1 c-type cytochrome [Histidinibacterium aquaticum]